MITLANSANRAFHTSGRKKTTISAEMVVKVEAMRAGKTCRLPCLRRWCIMTMVLSMIIPKVTVMPASA